MTDGNIEVVIMSGLVIIMVVIIIVFCLVFALRDSRGIKHIRYSSSVTSKTQNETFQATQSGEFTDDKQEEKKQTEQNNRSIQETPSTQRITIEDSPKEDVSKGSHANRKITWF